MDKRIREAIEQRLAELGISRSEWARRMGKQRQHVTDLLTGHRGKVPKMITEALDSLGLELTVKLKGEKDAS